MRDKRGQVTIFIIIAVVIIGATVGYFAFKDSIKISGIPANIEPVYTSFLSCLEDISKEGIYQIALHGGYYNVPNETSITYFTEEIPYYYINSENNIPSINLIEDEFGGYVSENLEGCFNLNNFKKQGFDINIINYSVSAKINTKEANIKMDYPITIQKGETKIQLKEFETSIDTNIQNLYGVSKEIVNSYSKNPGAVCLTCLDKISKKNNVEIKSIPILNVSIFENNIIWFFISEKEDYSENKLTYVFVIEQ